MVFWFLVISVIVVPIVVGIISADSGFTWSVGVLTLLAAMLLSVITLAVAGTTSEDKVVSTEVSKIVPLTSRSGVEGYVLLGEAKREPTANYKVAGSGALTEDYRTFEMKDVKINESKDITEPTATVRVVEREVPWAFPFPITHETKIEINIPVGGIGSL